jgi:predicted secreted protein
MRLKNRAFALIWILVSAIFCCGVFSQYEKNLAPTTTISAPMVDSQIDKEKLSIFLIFTTLLSLSMGVFFFAYSDELEIYIGNYQRTKEI